MIRPTQLCLTLLTCIVVRDLGAQQAEPFRRDTIRATLVGRAETAELAIDYVTGARRLDRLWGDDGGPVTPGGGPPAFLQTTLPIQLGVDTIPAGRYRLLTARDHDQPVLVLSRVGPLADTMLVPATEQLRVPMVSQRLERAADGLYIQVAIVRNGMDTVSQVTSTSKRGTHVTIEVRPATTATFVIILGRTRLESSIAAR